MKRVKLYDRPAPALVRRTPTQLPRSVETLGVADSCCLRCPDQPCIQFDPDEQGNGNTSTVCPVNAIHNARSDHGPVISEDCIGCGLCAVRCPVGALHFTQDGMVQVIPPDSEMTIPAENENEFYLSRSHSTRPVKWPERTWGVLAKRMAGSASELKQQGFYPFVAQLFTTAGFPAWRPAQGDTSNRIDLILIDDANSIPAEIKSRTESTVINVKSVQQALENRIILDERSFASADPTSSTLIVGYDYPSARSDVTELINDVQRAFGIKIGMITLVDLCELALRYRLANTPISRSTLANLLGQLK